MNESPNFPANNPRMGTDPANDPRVHGTPTPDPAAAPGTGPASTDPYAGAPYAGAAYTAGAPGYGYAAVPPPGTPNAATALVLGFIPGVGAMYNGQFAKGLAHIVIFAVLVSLSDNVNGVFGLLVAGWIFYMVFDAYQTARARRDGLQVPDPFGLNNIGERFGIGHGPNWSDFTARPAHGIDPVPGNPAYSAAPPAGATPAPGASTAGFGGAPPAYPAYPAYGIPGDAAPAYPQAQYPGTAYTAGTEPVFGTAPATFGTAPSPFGTAPSPFGAATWPGASPFSTPYAGVYSPPSPFPPGPPPPAAPAAQTGSSLPSGALWLIGLGALALVSTLGHDFFWPTHLAGGGILILLGAVLVFRRVQEAQRLYPTHTAAASWFSISRSKGGVFLAVIGLFLLIHTTHRWHSWNYTWPYLLILLGVYQIAERAAYNRMVAATPATYNPPGHGATAEPEPVSTGPVVTPPTASHPDHLSILPRDEEGQ